MDNALQLPPREDTTCAAQCSSCGQEIYRETVVTGGGVPIPHVRVTGVFLRFVDKDSQPFGPVWPLCDDCGSDPLLKPEVRAAYKQLLAKRAN